MKSVIHLLARTLQIAGVLALGYGMFVIVRAQWFQAYEKVVFNWSRMERQHASPSPSVSKALNPGSSESPAPKIDSVIGWIEIPRLNLSTIILEGEAESQFQYGAGHVPGTGLPGKAGNVVIAAHRDTYFRPLRNISPGDEIVLTTLNGSFRYIVDSIKITNPRDISVLRASAEPSLTLITCYPFSFVGSAPDRFIVRARSVDPTPVPEQQRASISSPPAEDNSGRLLLPGGDREGAFGAAYADRARELAEEAETRGWELAAAYNRGLQSAGHMAGGLRRQASDEISLAYSAIPVRKAADKAETYAWDLAARFNRALQSAGHKAREVTVAGLGWINRAYSAARSS
jgi:sortase A